MATFYIPPEWEGKTWRDVRNQYREPFRADLLAEMMGTNETTRLVAGTPISVTDPGSSEYQFVSKYLPTKSPTTQTSGSIAEQIISSVQPQIDAEKKLAEKLFGKDNPFVFDEYSAKEAAKAEYEPYYSQMLKDYLDVIGVKRESLSGEQQLLQALKTTPEGTAGEKTREYERAVTQAEKGFAGRGMFFSGTKQRNLGEAEVEREQDVGQTALETQNKYRDIFGTGQAYETAVQGGIETRRGEQAKAFYAPRIMEYARTFPNENNLLAGYIPAEYLRY